MFAGTGVTPHLLGYQVVHEDVCRLDRRDAMALSHDPGAGFAGQYIRQQIAHISHGHIERSACMAFRLLLEVVGFQRSLAEVDRARISHVDYKPHD